jgi:hypothetical protein
VTTENVDRTVMTIQIQITQKKKMINDSSRRTACGRAD